MTAGEEVEKAKFTPSPNAVDITPEKDGGVLKEIIKEGEGNELPGSGCTVRVNYHGTLTDGTVFDSYDSFEFTLGEGSVIKAWDIGIATMKKGEVALLICKPKYAYGEAGNPPKIPPAATLLFEVTLIDWIPEDLTENKDGGILRTVIEKNALHSSPTDNSLVEIHITGKYNGRVFEDRDVSFNLYEASEFGVVEGIEIALKKFKKGEKSNLILKPKYAFKEEGNKEFGIPPNAEVTYTVELKKFVAPAQSWDMDPSEQLSQASMLKEKATNYMKAGKYPVAIKIYNNLMQYIESDAGFSEEENTQREALLLAVRLNLALAYLKTNDLYEAKKACDRALELDPNNVKGLFRRGQTYYNMDEPENAKLDFEAVLKLEPTNKLAANQVLLCCKKIKEHREKEKKIYANMFEHFAKRDKEAVRFGWWDEEKKEPIVEAIVQEDEEVEDMKAEKRKQLEHLKKLAEAKKKEENDVKHGENEASKSNEEKKS